MNGRTFSRKSSQARKNPQPSNQVMIVKKKKENKTKQTRQKTQIPLHLYAIGDHSQALGGRGGRAELTKAGVDLSTSCDNVPCVRGAAPRKASVSRGAA